MTDKGAKLLNKIQIGGSFEITRVSAGSGEIKDFSDMDENLYKAYARKLTDLHKHTCDVSIISNRILSDNTSVLTALLSNKDLTEAIFLHEVGIFAKDPDAGEVLYAYSYSDVPTYLPRFSGYEADKVQWQLITTIGNAENVTVNIEKIEINIDEFNGYIKSVQDNLKTQIIGINANFNIINEKLKEFENTAYFENMFQNFITQINNNITSIENRIQGLETVGLDLDKIYYQEL